MFFPVSVRRRCYAELFAEQAVKIRRVVEAAVKRDGEYRQLGIQKQLCRTVQAFAVDIVVERKSGCFFE